MPELAEQQFGIRLGDVEQVPPRVDRSAASYQLGPDERAEFALVGTRATVGRRVRPTRAARVEALPRRVVDGGGQAIPRGRHLGSVDAIAVLREAPNPRADVGDRADGQIERQLVDDRILLRRLHREPDADRRRGREERRLQLVVRPT